MKNKNTYMHMKTHTRIRRHTYTHTKKHIHTQEDTHTRTQINTYIHKKTHIHTRIVKITKNKNIETITRSRTDQRKQNKDRIKVEN